MPLLNETEDFKKFLSVETVEIGDELSPDDTANFEVDWLGKESDIEFTYGSCHCTDSFYEDGKIKGNINIARSNYDRETGVINQYVFIYIKDGQDYWLSDSKKRRILNPSKGWARLLIAGKVKKE